MTATHISPNRPLARLACESLEHRDNPAGNVAVGLAGDGVLWVIGDALPNQVSIQQSSAGDIFVFGLNDTLVNGQTGVYVGNGILSGMNVQMGAGDDVVDVAGIYTTGWIYMTAGDENDGIVMQGVTADVVWLEAQGGNDAVALNGVVAMSGAVVDGGTGFDAVDFRQFGLSTPFPYYFNIEQFVASGV